ncbi:hypothetical protein J437_LFUL019029, partial [Ladona fulva]
MEMLKFREKVLEGLLKNEVELILREVQQPQEKKTVRHQLQKYEGSARQSRKRCLSCYESIRNEKGPKEASTKAKK